MFRSSVFQQYFRVYPLSQIKSEDNEVNYGGKIVLPQSSLHKLTTLHISYPMMFEIRNGESSRKSHCGVLEFTAPEGRAYVPQWLLATLNSETGSLVQITNLSLPLGEFIKIEPQSVDFLEISDPKAVLEHALRNFTTMTIGDIFEISYNSRTYGIKVLEIKPENSRSAICVVETDLEVDFAPPVGYVEPTVEKKQQGPVISGQMARDIDYAGLVNKKMSVGARLSGKSVEQAEPQVDASIYKNSNAPALNLPDGQLFFGFPLIPDEEPSDISRFQGEGFTLRQKK